MLCLWCAFGVLLSLFSLLFSPHFFEIISRFENREPSFEFLCRLYALFCAFWLCFQCPTSVFQKNMCAFRQHFRNCSFFLLYLCSIMCVVYIFCVRLQGCHSPSNSFKNIFQKSQKIMGSPIINYGKSGYWWIACCKCMYSSIQSLQLSSILVLYIVYKFIYNVLDIQ